MVKKGHGGLYSITALAIQIHSDADLGLIGISLNAGFTHSSFYVGARAVSLSDILRCPHTLASHWQSRCLATILISTARAWASRPSARAIFIKGPATLVSASRV